MFGQVIKRVGNIPGGISQIVVMVKGYGKRPAHPHSIKLYFKIFRLTSAPEQKLKFTPAFVLVLR